LPRIGAGFLQQFKELKVYQMWFECLGIPIKRSRTATSGKFSFCPQFCPGEMLNNHEPVEQASNKAGHWKHIGGLASNIYLSKNLGEIFTLRIWGKDPSNVTSAQFSNE